MSMNHLGKFLVVVQTALSVLALAWAIAIYLQRVDWGWKEPREDLGFRVPSEIDKRIAALQQDTNLRVQAQPVLRQALKVVDAREKDFYGNHEWYNRILTELKTSPNPLQVKQLNVRAKPNPGETVLVLTPSGRPELGDATGLDKSYQSYMKEEKTTLEEIAKTQKRIDQLIAKGKEQIFYLNGKDEANVVIKPGLYSMLIDEKALHDQLRFETEYLTELWVDVRKNADIFLSRRRGLQNTLGRLEQAIERRNQ